MSFVRFDDGADFDAAAMDANFNSLRAEINNLPTQSLDEKALNYQHLSGGIIPGVDGKNITTIAQSAATSRDIDVLYPGFGSSVFNDPSSGPGTTEWNLLRSGGLDLREVGGVMAGGLQLGMAASGVAALMVFLNAEIKWIRGDTSMTGAVAEDSHAGSFTLMYLDSLGAWNNLTKCERHLMEPVRQEGAGFSALRCYRDVAIRTLIRASDITTGDGRIFGVQAVGAVNVVSGAPLGGEHLTQWQANMSVIPFHAADPV